MVNSMINKELSLTLPNCSGSLEHYTQAVRAIPVLTAEQERLLGLRLQNENDLEAAQQLVMSHLRFVVHIARGYNGYGLPLGDLIQEGNIGLMKAVKRFKPELGVRLVSYAVHWIKAEIHEFILRNWRIVKIATTKAQRKLFFNLRSSKKRLGWFNAEEVKTIARELGVKPETVVEMESRLSGHDTTFDAGPENDSDDKPVFSPSYYLEAPQADPALLVENDDLKKNNHDQLSSALETLDDRSKDILAQRWLAEDKSTLHELADKYNISAERIRQLENNAIKKLRGLMET